MTNNELVVPVVAIGDVHGCASLLDEVLEQRQRSGASFAGPCRFFGHQHWSGYGRTGGVSVGEIEPSA